MGIISCVAQQRRAAEFTWPYGAPMGRFHGLAKKLFTGRT
jgi:hypothetical protein